MTSQIHSRICAVIVTFNPESILEENIRALLSEVDKVVIVDNSSTNERRRMIGDLACRTGVEVIWNPKNEGIAAALNRGIQAALSENDYRWIATFDQDSRVLPGFKAAMLAAYQACPFREQVGLLGPCYIHSMSRTDWQKEDRQRASLFKELPSTMTSGNLIDPKSFDVCGMFDASFFIDYVDHEFCLRLRKHGLRVIEATQAKLEHRLGSPTLHRIFARTVVTSNHSAGRRYYNTRNRLRVYRTYIFAEPLWIASDMYGWSKEILKLLLFEQDRKAKLSSILKGAWDAIRETTGAGPSRSAAGNS